MQLSPNDGMSGLLEWSGPVIYDRLRLAYNSHVSDPFVAIHLAKAHARVWRALLSSDLAAFELHRADLLLLLVQQGLTLDHLTEADTETMDELLDIVIARFRRSPRASRGYHIALMQLASFLTPAQAAA